MALASVDENERTERGHSPRPLGALIEWMTKRGLEQDIVVTKKIAWHHMFSDML
jgi:hypothetical protein